MKMLAFSVYRKARLFFLLFFALAIVLSTGTMSLAKEKKSAKTGSGVSNPATIGHIAPFDGNRIYNYIVNNGDIVTDNVGGHSGFYWPSTPRTNRTQTEADLIGENTADYSSGLWIVGTVNDTARTAIVEYTSEYVAGKVLPNGARDDGTLAKYRVYKIIKGDGPGVTDWDEWPAADGAPTNTDGTPKLTGDQTLWFVMNDLDAARHQGPIAGSPPIGLEVQTSVFGFNAAGPLGDIMFVQWVIINKGTANLDSAFIGVWDDPDLGDASDDLVGCDVDLGMGFVYNGDANDGQYGTRTPALGFDFFQGPEVPIGSGNRLKMTSFAKYTNGAPAGRGDPVNVEEVYNYMTGYWQDGSPFIDPTTNAATKFINSGDPVTRSGWLDSSPADRRFLMSSGPFQLAVGDTQVVVGAKVAAPGANPSSSIAALRFFDSFAQSAFDNDFDIIQAPLPKVKATRLDREIVLTWLQDAATVEAFEDRGYAFQGYKVYQGASAVGPFTNIAVFDLADGVQNIFDKQFDPNSGLVIELPAVIAADVGVQRYVSIKTDAVFNINQRLSNYRDYYFAVTSYITKLDATPRLIESPISAIRVAPTAPDFGASVNVKTGDVVNFANPTGTGDGDLFYQVVDPDVMVDASYRITWNDDSTPDDQAYTWNLDRGGSRVLSNQRITGYDSEGNVQDDAPIVDGLQLQVLPAVFFNAPTHIFKQQQTVDVNPLNDGLSVVGGSLFGTGSDYVADFYGGGTTDLEKLKADLEFRFTGVRVSDAVLDTTIVSGGQLAIVRSQSSAAAVAVLRIPFEIWDIQNNVQINVVITDRNADGRSPWGATGVPQYYRMRGRSYMAIVYAPYNEATLAVDTFTRADPNATWLLFFETGVGGGPPSAWDTGDRLVVRFADPTFPTVDTYTFSTSKAIVTGQSAIKQSQLAKINIVPNPYWAHNVGERDPINRFLRLTNIAGQGVTIRIFTLAGELVRVIDDDARKADVPSTLGLQYANWDLRNSAGIPVASGVYIVHFEVAGVGTAVRKAVIMMPEERLDIF